MIVGSGLLARAFSDKFKQRSDVCIYAAGVSNSNCTNLGEFDRERERLSVALDSTEGVGAFVYFGTCSIEDPEVLHTQYVQHKLAMERLVAQHPRQIILRLPQMAGRSPNPHTLLNYLYARISRSEAFSIWRYAYRNIIDVDDVVTLACLLIENQTMRNCIINLANPHSCSMPEIISAMEQKIGKKAIFDIVEKGYHYAIDVTSMLRVLPQTNIRFDEHYLKRVLKKTQASAYVRQSNAQRSQGRLDQAERTIHQGMNTYPDHIGMLIEYAEIAIARKDWSEGENRLQKVLNKFKIKTPAGVYVRQSITQRCQGEFDRAERTIMLGMENYTDYIDLFIEYVEIAIAQKKWFEASNRLHLILNTFKDAPPAAYYKFSSVNRRIGAFEEAEIIIRKGMEKHPSHVGILIEYAEIAMAQKNWIEAAERWQFIINNHGKKVPVHVHTRLKIAQAANGSFNTEQSMLVDRLLNGYYDFVDFGTSRGDSIDYAMRIFNARAGIGIDTDQDKINETKARGLHAINYDINDLPDTEIVKFTILKEFLEHVSNPKDVFSYILKACMISSDFVYIRQPFFDSDGYLMTKGLKLFWSDWKWHPNRMTTLDFYVVLTKLREKHLINNFSIHVEGPISSSSDSVVHPLTSSNNQHHYSSMKHPWKPNNIKLGNYVFNKTLVFISKSSSDHYSNFRNVTFDKTIYQSWEE